MSDSVGRQVEIMEKFLEAFPMLLDKTYVLNHLFDNDPEYTKEARDIVRGNISKKLSNDGILKGINNG